MSSAKRYFRSTRVATALVAGLIATRANHRDPDRCGDELDHVPGADRPRPDRMTNPKPMPPI